MNWNPVVNKINPYLVRIDTPTGHGTGFLCAYNQNQTICGIATALHVIADTDEWQQPIRIHNHDFSKRVFLKESDRVILADRRTDSAVIMFVPSDLDLPKSPIQLRPIDSALSIGQEVGWLGFPGIESSTLCFFSGNISARRQDRSAYLVDGVAIHGVSGGPVVYSSPEDGMQVVGVVSAYKANRQRGEALPGLVVAQDVSHFHGVIRTIRDRDEAIQKRAQLEAEAKAKLTAGAEAKPSDSDPKTPSSAVEAAEDAAQIQN